MFPVHVTEVLQQLSYLALIIIAPCTLYNTVQNITNSLLLKNHIALDDERFRQVNQSIGKHDSQINDIKSDAVAKIAETLRTLMHNTAKQ